VTGRRIARALLPLVLLPVLVAGCGGEVTVSSQDERMREGAQLFNERCSGCHSLESANSYGSRPEGSSGLKYSERTNGPDFNQRKEKSVNDVLFAIRNGGFSGAIMPANVVVGSDADRVAEFVVACSGSKPAPSCK
jgi:mono/diheme cytochrome c family protein